MHSEKKQASGCTIFVAVLAALVFFPFVLFCLSAFLEGVANGIDKI